MTFELFIDDSGSRNPDHKPQNKNEKDAFALGGILIPEESAESLKDSHKQLVEKFSITEPLHSSSIRNKKGSFIWLEKEPQRASEFHTALADLFRYLPGSATACVISRPGYNSRYKPLYDDDRWQLCKTAYSILIERSVKYALAHKRRLRVIIEKTGKREDRLLEYYHLDLQQNGCPFNPVSSEGYSPLSAAEFSKVLFKKPKFVTKKSRLIQLADLALYPLIMGKYDNSYRPFQILANSGKLLKVSGTDRGDVLEGVKYSCFDEA